MCPADCNVNAGQDGIGKEIWSDGSGFEGSFRPCSWDSSCETYSMNDGKEFMEHGEFWSALSLNGSGKAKSVVSARQCSRFHEFPVSDETKQPGRNGDGTQCKSVDLTQNA